MVKPWDIQGDEKGDVVHSYSNAETRYLEDEGYLDAVKEFL
jgi:initiation factor 1A